MPLYEFKYTDVHGKEHIIEELVPMGTTEIKVEVSDEVYTAKRIFSAHGNMAHNWAKGREDADLPPVDHPPINPRR